MPNHIHTIITNLEKDEIRSAGGINTSPTIKCDIPNVIGKFKAGVTRIVGDG